MFVFQYIIIGGLGVIMLISSNDVIDYNLTQYIGWFIVALYLCLIGYLGLDSVIRIDAANKLLEKFK